MLRVKFQRISGQVVSGRTEEFGKTAFYLLFAFVVAVILVYMVLASQFNSFIQPVIMVAQPLAIIGGVVAFWATGHTLNMFSMIGLVLLMGLVAKNSILLVDLTNQRREGGKSIEQSLKEACPIRLRPILMTSLTIFWQCYPQPSVSVPAQTVTHPWPSSAECSAPLYSDPGIPTPKVSENVVLMTFQTQEHMIYPCEMTNNRKLKIGFLVYDGLQALDLFGPQEAFAAANQFCGAGDLKYETLVIGETSRPITTESGISIGVHTDIQNCPRLHTLIIPGGAGSRRENISENVVEWVEQQAVQVKRIGSVCTGLFILARTGVLDGCLATTHWHHIDEARTEFSDLKLKSDALYIRDGKIITSAGVTAGIDMALALIEEDMSVNIASMVARELVVFLKRPGGQDQFSSFLKLQSKTQNRFGDLVAWIANNLKEDLCIERLASRVFLSERQFRRIFSQTFDESPARAVERIRIDVAQGLLTSKSLTIEQIAVETGFRSADAFRRAFYRRTGVNPADYRQRFNCI